jgi:hypothetical protein
VGIQSARRWIPTFVAQSVTITGINA